MYINVLWRPGIRDLLTNFRESVRYMRAVFKHDFIMIHPGSRVLLVIQDHLKHGCARCEHFYGHLTTR